MRIISVRSCAFALSIGSLALLVSVLTALLSGCATSEELEFVRSEPGANINLTLASTTLSHPPTTVTVTIDDSLVATQPLSKVVEKPRSYRLKLSPGHHELIARANTGRTKAVFPVFIHDHTEWITLTYQCTCEGANHDEQFQHFVLEQSGTSTGKPYPVQ